MRFFAAVAIGLFLSAPAMAQQPAPAPAPAPAPNPDQNSDEAILEQCRTAILAHFPDDQSRHKALIQCAIAAGPKIALRVFHCVRDPQVLAIQDKTQRDIAILDCLEGKPIQ